ncbi:TRAP transporter permease [Afifella aestuarii]|uniref:TRAP transporter permease n=1 Tax=Afifella aestuarii TaxID=1909496 RepID=UPI000FE30B57|nr:TRAP transporter fused permease subunit [Afifella aestuarii]
MDDPPAKHWPWVALGLVSIAFHIGLIFYGLAPALAARPIHMALLLPWMLILPAKTPWQRWSGWALSLLGITGCLYIALNASDIADQYGFIDGPFQMGLAVLLIAVALETARRAIGWPLPLVALATLAYGLFGQYVPGEFGHPGLPLESFLGTMTLAEGGLWGQLTGVSVNVVAIFVILGAVLNAGEAGKGFMNVATVVAGRLKGGAAKVATLSSALFGSISGSASANVASTGAITIPAMTKLGYPKSLAGAVEAVASSGGQIMPPLMGAGAFVMVELTGTPYTQIMAAALPPAILYFLTVWVGVDAFATRYDLRPVESTDQPGRREALITSMFFAVPFLALLAAIFGAGFTPQYAASVAILTATILLFFDVRLRFSFRHFGNRFAIAAVTAGRQVAMIGSIIICASIVIGVLSLTGLGVKVTSTILSVANDSLWPALLLTALACLILGMEVPTTAAYVICISVAGPALAALGLKPLVAHLFVFWFALLSTITPPVCGAVFIAAGMIGENWLKVAGKAMLLGIGLYVIPLGMIANPSLLALGVSPFAALLAFVKVGVGLSMLSYGIIAARPLMLRVPLVLAGVLFVFVSV